MSDPLCHCCATRKCLAGATRLVARYDRPSLWMCDHCFETLMNRHRRSWRLDGFLGAARVRLARR